MVTLGKTKKKKNRWRKYDFVKLTRSFLAYDSGGGTRPLLNNEIGHNILKNISYSRGGALPDFKTIMSYKGVDVIEVNTTRNIPSRRLHQNTPEGKEFFGLVNKLFGYTNKILENVSTETNKPEETVRETVNENEYPKYVEFTDDQINDMVEEKTTNLPPA